MRVIITGGSGLIGRALTEELARRNDEVILLSRNPTRLGDLPAGARAQAWDGKTAQGWGPLVTADTAIVNLAGENLAAGRWTAERKRAIRESRLDAGRAVVQAVRDAPDRPRVVIQASAVGYYGPRGDEEIDEATPPGTDFLAQVCVEWEGSTGGVEALGVRRAIIRTGIVLSLAGGALPRLLLPFRLFVGGPLGSGRQPFPWIHLADEVGGIVFLLDTATARGPYNLTAPGVLTNAEFSRVVGRVLGRPAGVPTPALALRAAFGEMATVLLDGQRAVPQRLRAAGYAFRYPDAEAALRSLLKEAQG